MKRVAVALVTSAVVATATGAAGTGGGEGAYESARVWKSPIGAVYGPVHAGPETSTSYGFVVK